MSEDPHQELDDELQFHVEQRIRDFIARGMTPEAARAAAAQRIGDLARVRRACTAVLAAAQAAEGRRTVLKMSWLDVKLGLRMLVKYPGLSLVSVIGMAVAITISAGYFALFGAMLDSTLPFDPEDRVVVVLTRSANGPGNMNSSVHDFERWRDAVTSIADLSAFRDNGRNLITADGGAHLVRVASMTAAGFRVSGVAPVLGRTLRADDERPASPPVVVIAAAEWQRRFNGDPAILGQTIRLDEGSHTVVGVMPEGFAFPINHRYWVPLRTTDIERSPSADPSVTVFGRLADGVSLDDARAELTTIGERLAAALPQTHQGRRPDVAAYTDAFIGLDTPGAQVAVRSAQFGFTLMMLIVAVNVAILVYARTATRTGEIVVRTALGASRARVVTQLFVEALVPAVAAAAIGLLLLNVPFTMARSYFRNSPEADGPYWINDASLAISPIVVLYALVLAVIAAVVVGVLPALKATDRRLQAGLQQFSARGAGMRLGRTWTALIVLQVAVAVAVLPPALNKAERGYRTGMRPPPPSVTPLLRATLEAPGAAHMTAWLETLTAEPGVGAVTFAERFPGEELQAVVEADSGVAQPQTIRAQPNRVAANFFDVLGVRILAGRPFTASDAGAGGTAVIVDEIFATRLGRGGVLGQRIRFVNPSADGAVEPGPWLEIVGVVPAFTADIVPPVGFRDPLPRFYLAGKPGQDNSTTVIVQVSGGDPRLFSQRLRETAASVHPTLKLYRVASVVQEIDREREVLRYIALAMIVVTGAVLLLSAAGIYAMMSFTVAKRRREIGIRAALGANARRVLMGVFGRAAAQVGGGVATGLAIAAALEWLGGAGFMGGRGHVLLPTVALVMFSVGVLAALGPARRGLMVQPTEALRDE